MGMEKRAAYAGEDLYFNVHMYAHIHTRSMFTYFHFTLPCCVLPLFACDFRIFWCRFFYVMCVVLSCVCCRIVMFRFGAVVGRLRIILRRTIAAQTHLPIISFQNLPSATKLFGRYSVALAHRKHAWRSVCAFTLNRFFYCVRHGRAEFREIMDLDRRGLYFTSTTHDCLFLPSSHGLQCL